MIGIIGVHIYSEDDHSVGSVALNYHLLKGEASSRCDTEWYQFSL